MAAEDVHADDDQLLAITLSPFVFRACVCAMFVNTGLKIAVTIMYKKAELFQLNLIKFCVI